MGENSNAKSKMEGLAEAERVKSFLAELRENFPNMDEKSIVGLWNTLRKEDALKAVAQGNARLYFTPKDANLSIESHEVQGSEAFHFILRFYFMRGCASNRSVHPLILLESS